MNALTALTAFHASTAKIADESGLTFAQAQGFLFDRMTTESPELAQKVLRALLAEMASA